MMVSYRFLSCTIFRGMGFYIGNQSLLGQHDSLPYVIKMDIHHKQHHLLPIR